jgi:hypothetical protein
MSAIVEAISFGRSIARDRIRSLVCGVASPARKTKRLLMWKAYYDESGSDAKSRYFVLAGYVSSVDDWELFSDEWQGVLDQAPRLDYFKTTEAFQIRDQFAGWPEEQRNARVLQFLSIVQARALFGCAVAMPKDIYERHIRGVIPKFYDNPYYICFVESLEFLSDTMSRFEQKGPIDFVFDENNLEPRVRELFDEFKLKGGPNRGLIGEIDFRDDKKVLPLQAADLLAWRTRAHLNLNNEAPGAVVAIDKVRPASASLIIEEQALVRFVEAYQRSLHKDGAE